MTTEMQPKKRKSAVVAAHPLRQGSSSPTRIPAAENAVLAR